MSRINFLLGDAISFNEMNRLQELAGDERTRHLLYERYIKKGILPTANGRPSGFELYKAGSNLYISRGAAITRSNKLILLRQDRELTVPAAEGTYHVYISPLDRRVEQGTVSIDPDGIMIGKDTEFTSVLRSSAHGSPIFVRLEGTDDQAGNFYGVFRVETVNNNTRASIQANVVAGDDSTQTLSLPPTNLEYQYRVIPYTGIGSARANDLPFYIYDDVYIEQRAGTTEPLNIDADEEKFKIGRYNIGLSGITEIKDARVRYTASDGKVYFSSTGATDIGVDDAPSLESTFLPPLLKKMVYIPSPARERIGLSFDWSIELRAVSISYNIEGVASISVPSDPTDINANSDAVLNSDGEGVAPAPLTDTEDLVSFFKRPYSFRVYVEGESTPLFIKSVVSDDEDTNVERLILYGLNGVATGDGKNIRIVPNADKIGIIVNRGEAVGGFGASMNAPAATYKQEFSIDEFENNELHVDVYGTADLDVSYYYVSNGIASDTISSWRTAYNLLSVFLGAFTYGSMETMEPISISSPTVPLTNDSDIEATLTLTGINVTNEVNTSLSLDATMSEGIRLNTGATNIDSTGAITLVASGTSSSPGKTLSLRVGAPGAEVEIAATPGEITLEATTDRTLSLNVNGIPIAVTEVFVLEINSDTDNLELKVGDDVLASIAKSALAPPSDG